MISLIGVVHVLGSISLIGVVLIRVDLINRGCTCIRVDLINFVDNAHAILADENQKKIYDSYGTIRLKLAEQVGEAVNNLDTCIL